MSVGSEHMLLPDYIASIKDAISSNVHYDSGYMDRAKEVHIIDIFDNFLEGYVTTAGLDTRITTLALTTSEENAYRYNPKALSTKIYGTPYMWELIMRLNGLEHPGQMDFSKPVRVHRPEVISDFFKRINKFKEMLGGQWLDVKDTYLTK